MTKVLLLAYFSFASVFIPLSLFLHFRKKLDIKLRLLGYLLIFSTLSDFISLLFFQFSLNSFWIINLFLIVQFFLGYSLLSPHLSIPSYHNHWILYVLLIFFIFNFSLIQGPWVFNTYTNTVGSILLILTCIRFFYVLLRDLRESSLMSFPFFWIAVAFLVYYSGNLFLFIVNNYLTIGEGGTHPIMWILHNVLNISKNVFFTIAIWKGQLRRT